MTDHRNCRCVLIRTLEPEVPVTQGLLSISYTRSPLPDGRVRVERAVHCIDRRGEKDTFTDEWIEEPK